MKVPHEWPGKEKACAIAIYIILSDRLGEGWIRFCERYIKLSRRDMKACYGQLLDAAHATSTFGEWNQNADIQQGS